MLGGALNAPGAVLLAPALVTIAIAVQTLRIPDFAGRTAVVRALISAGAWSFGAAMETMPISAAAKGVWAALVWCPVLALVGFLLLFSWQYVRGEQRPVPWIWQSPHWMMMVLTVGIALFNQRLHLMYLSTVPLSPGGPTEYVHGPWFFVAVTYGYILLLLALSIVIEAIGQSSGLHRRQYIGFAVAMVLPWLANLCNTLNLFHPFGVDPTPIGFLATGAIIVFLVRKERLFTLPPVPRSVLVEAIPDPVLVIDLDGEVVDANAAAVAVIGPSKPVIGRQLVDIAVLAPLHQIAVGDTPPAELTLGPDRRFEVTLMPLTYGGRRVGHLLLLRDLTRRARFEVKLREEAARDSLLKAQQHG
jgi:PAS domain-containing protein